MLEIPNDGATRLCLVRHGETEWNAARRMQGHIDVSLNATGRKQAAAAGQWLRGLPIRALYSSDLQRAWTTAQAIALATGIDPQPVCEMRERCMGVFEGLTYDEAKQKFPEDYARFDGRDPDFDVQTGESLRQMHVRITGKLIELEARHRGQIIVVVLHGGVLDIINRFVRGNPLETPRDFLIPNAGLNWIACRDGRWQIEIWGDTRHLEDGALDELPS
ncbi:MAG TPA: histidine phosphatase family protein [Rhodocyclaceae bacterium]|nr:histidine phosphatase family protein [Rhodocyclaceae bacterium]